MKNIHILLSYYYLLISNFPSNRLSLLGLGWTRYLDHRKSRKTPYIMSVDSVLQFVHNNEKLTNSRMALLEMLQSYPQHKGDMSKLAEHFSFINPKERIFARILLYFPDVLHKCLLSNEFSPLV